MPPRSDAFARERAAVGALAALVVVLAFAAPSFFAPSNLRDLLLDNSAVLIAAVGMTCVIVSREIDISIGSQFAIACVATGLMFKAGAPMFLAVPAVLLLGALMGA